MINNAPYKSIEHKGLTIEGYSRAAVQSCWRVPELKVGFDLGAQPWDFMGTNTWFVSHTHLDHVAALPVYVARRRMMKMEPPTIYLPEHAVDVVAKMLKLFTRLDRGRLPCELVGTKPGDEIDLSREHVVTAVATEHTVPSMGYIVWERRRKLKEEYQGLAGHEIRDLRLAGTEVTNESRFPLVAYLGDSTAAGLDNNPAMYDASVLIMEITFVSARHRPERVRKFGHIHLDDVVARKDRFNNEIILAAHFSTRYHQRQIRTLIERAIPDMLDDRLHLWM